MIQLSKDQIKSVAQELEMGMKCYCNLDSNEILTLPDFDNNIHAEEEIWKNEIAQLKENFHRYYALEGMSSHKSFNLMLEFIDTIEEPELRKRLVYLMDKPHPFRSFKNEMDDSGDYRQKWFDFKAEKYVEWVEYQIGEYNATQDAK